MPKKVQYAKSGKVHSQAKRSSVKTTTVKGSIKRSLPTKTRIIRRFPISEIKASDVELIDKETIRDYFKTGNTIGTGLYYNDTQTLNYFIDLPLIDWPPIILSNTFELLDGFHRVSIANYRRLKTIPVKILSKEESEQFEYS